ncbi:MAG: FadR/GntR family transcriptional regulator [Polaromonas sp.]|uniref:FadR/GntR family transcriptional regulator n=1 Tax=Polaromonas sp. TaxID=1869339 RepID=UPI002730CE10|nr:FadR/GntR family transcriptional regulator [Polaromonas sp.]MDP2255765.1 FadR/GntR family transcriptional regulator [Polaromonas sp.]
MNSRKTPSHFETAAAPFLDPARRARRPRGLVDEIVETLATSIREGPLQPGDKLPTEAEIMVRFDVSRTVVRESLSKLQASGLVETRHGIGTFVLPPQEVGNFKITAEDFATVADVISVLELRISLETEAAGLAAQRRKPENLIALEAALHAFHDSISRDSDAVPPDFQFHMEVARSTGNRHFADLMTYLGTMIIPRTRVNTAHNAPEGRLNYLQRVNSEHESIYIAIRDQDAEAARAAMRTHLSNSRERLRRGSNAHTTQTPGGVVDAPVTSPMAASTLA